MRAGRWQIAKSLRARAPLKLRVCARRRAELPSARLVLSVVPARDAFSPLFEIFISCPFVPRILHITSLTPLVPPSLQNIAGCYIDLGEFRIASTRQARSAELKTRTAGRAEVSC